MASIGDWIKRMDSARVALAFILLLGSVMVSVVSSVWTNIGIPARVDALEQTTAEHIRKEEAATERTEAATEWLVCSVNEMFEYFASNQQRPINPVKCKPDGGES